MRRIYYLYKMTYLFVNLCGILCMGCSYNNNNTPPNKCTKSPCLNKSDSLAMVNIYNKIGPWDTKWDLENIQTWYGVSIDLDTLSNEYRIVGFNNFGDFRGDFPEDFRKLTELRILGLGGGTLSGEIPSWIGELTKLEWLYLGWNSLKGTIPSEIGKLLNLKQLTIGNTCVGGNLPTELGNLSNLEILTIVGTNISGEIPKSLKNNKKMKKLYLCNNSLSGEFPVEILTPNLVVLCSDNNIRKLSFSVWLDNNDDLIPDLQGNMLQGEIPVNIIKTEKWLKFHCLVGNQKNGYGYINKKTN